MSKSMVQEVSLSSEYDFVKFCNTSRLVQVICLALQIVLVYSESANLSYGAFIFYMTLLGVYLWHVGRRWYFNIDGRYDTRQLMREPQNTAKLQYAIALLTASVLSLCIWSMVSLQNGVVYTVFYICSVLTTAGSFGLLALELYEVFAKGN